MPKKIQVAILEGSKVCAKWLHKRQNLMVEILGSQSITGSTFQIIASDSIKTKVVTE